MTKQYVSWSRGEHVREWTVLRRVHGRCPDLVPEPLDADLEADPPFVTMGVLPGSPLAGVPARRHHPDEIHAMMTRLMVGLELSGPAGEAACAARSFLVRLRLDRAGSAVLGHTDPNLANYLWDGHRIRIVDFEDAGRSDPEFELADLVEHLAARHTDWTRFLAMFDLDPDRLLNARRIFAIFWLHMLRPGGPAERRNPRGSLDQQAERVLHLLTDHDAR